MILTMGPLTVAASTVEVSAAWPLSSIIVRLDVLLACIVSASAAALVYGWARL